jgi:hypothetical protein
MKTTTFMKMTTLMAALAAASTFAQCAQAREHYLRHGAFSPPRYFNSAPATFQAWGPPQGGSQWQNTSPWQSASRAGYGGRPRAWCGWEMRQLVGGDPGPEYNLARNWAHWGHAGPAGIGAVVVWPHHVGKIVGQQNGEWVIESGNDGHALRTRARSIAGAIAIRWG